MILFFKTRRKYIEKMTLNEFFDLSDAEKSKQNTLDLSCNNLVEIEQWSTFCSKLEQFSILSIFDLKANALGLLKPEQWTVFCLALKKCNRLTILDLSFNVLNHLNLEEWLYFCQALEQFSVLITLNLSGNDVEQFSSEKWEALLHVISQHPALSDVDCGCISEKRSKELAAVLKPKQFSDSSSTLVRANSFNISAIEQTPFLSRTEFDQIMAQLQIVEKYSMQQTVFSLEEKYALQARIAVDSETNKYLAERQYIASQMELKLYYQTIQTHFSALMVASLGIGSGYVSIRDGMATQVIGWVGKAIASVFSPAALVTTILEEGVRYLDAKYREAFLLKVRVLGITITEAEILGEQIARFLVRAHFHAENVLSIQQAELDAQALIMAVIQADPPILRDEKTAEKILQLIWGDATYCIQPLLVSTTTLTPNDVFLSLDYGVKQQTSCALKKATEHQQLEEKLQTMERELLTLQMQIKNTALKKDLAMTQAKVAQLEGKHSSSRGGQALMAKPDVISDEKTTEEQFIELQKEYAKLQVQLHYVTEQTVSHHEQIEKLETISSSEKVNSLSQAQNLTRFGWLAVPKAERKTNSMVTCCTMM